LSDRYIKSGSYPYLLSDAPTPTFPILPFDETKDFFTSNRYVPQIDGYTNDGYPFLYFLIPKLQFFEYVQGNYITVHDIATAQNDFNNNGLAILEPIRAIITEELDGIYDLELECYIDSLGKWQFLLNGNFY